MIYFSLFLACTSRTIGVDEHTGPSLHQVQATGAFQRYRAVAAGGGGAAANSRLAGNSPRTTTRATTEEETPVSRQAGETLSGVPGARGDGVTTTTDALRTNKKAGVDDTDVPSEERTRDDGSAADGESGRQQQRRRRLAPEHHVALKHALSALWEDLDDNGGVGGEERAGEDAAPAAVASGDGRPGSTRGGLKASELSATVYGVKPGSPVGGSEEDELDGGGCQALECLMEDFEAVLVELEGEEWEARKTARESENVGSL